MIEGSPRARSGGADAYPWILSATILASSIVFIDSSAVNLALPVLQTELHASNAQAQWVIEAYSLFLSALILVGGSLGDEFGRRRVFVWGVAGFALASVLCALAQSASALILARAVQGLASALLTPGSLSILGASISEQLRGKAIGMWSSFTAMTAVAGPLVGGLIVQHASWRWIFLINIPLSLAAILITLRWVPESRDDEPGASRRIDWMGALLATVGLGALVYALIAAGGNGWTTPLIIWCVAGGIMLVAFVVTEARVPAPMMPLALFRSRTFSAVNLQTLLVYGALGGATFLLPFDLLQVQHYSPTVAGAVFLPFIALVALLSPWAGGLGRSIGVKTPLVAGSVIVACGLAGLALPSIGGSYWATFFLPTVALGFGMALVVAPLTTTVMDSVGNDHFGIGSGINNAVARTASLLAIAILSLFVASTFNHRLDRELVKLSPPPHILAAVNAQRPLLAGAQAPKTASGEMRQNIQNALAISYVAGFRSAMLLAALLALGGAACAAFGLPKKGARTGPATTFARE